MTQWEYIYPDHNGERVTVRMTEGEILAEYWEHWSGRMRERGKRGINPDRCIQDWVMMHWAIKVDGATS